MEEEVKVEVEKEECEGTKCCCHDDTPIEEDESLRDEDETPGYEVAYNIDDDSISNGIICEAAVTASNELAFTTKLVTECRQQLFDLIAKSDLDKEKVVARITKLQEFLDAAEKRTGELVSRIEQLLNKGVWSVRSHSHL